MGLRYPRDLQMLAHLALAAGCYWLALVHSLLWTPLAVFVGMHVVPIGHNHAHLPVFRTRWANEVLDGVIVVLSGVPLAFWRVHHLASHHRFTWEEGDWSSPFSFSGTKAPYEPIGYRYYQLTYLPLFCSHSALHILRGRNPRLMRSFLTTSLVFVLASALIVAGVGVWRWLAVMGVGYAAGGMMLGAANYFEHWSSYRAGEYLAWTFTCPIHNFLNYNIGYHLLHHQQPTLHWSLLRRVHEENPSSWVPELIEGGLFPGYRGARRSREWFARTAALEARAADA
jgi:fatty acid desaturase